MIGGSSQAYNNANIQAAINAIPGFPGGAVVTGAASTGFVVTFSGTGRPASMCRSQLHEPELRRLLRRDRRDEPRRGERSFTLNYNGNGRRRS